MNPPTANDWLAANQRHLAAALAGVRRALEPHAQRSFGTSPAPPAESSASPAGQPSSTGQRDTGGTFALEQLCTAFGLSSFERDLVLLCAGGELDSSFRALCGAAQGDPRRDFPTFSLALAALPEAHWSALAPSSPLRYWRLVEAGAGDALTTAPLRLDERVLHFLTGLNFLDERLRGLVRPVAAEPKLPSSQLDLARRVADAWTGEAPVSPPPALQLCGADTAAQRAVAVAACSRLGVRLHALRATNLPSGAAERETLARLWEREAILSHSALLIESEHSDDAETTRNVAAFLESVQGLVLLARREPLTGCRRAMLRFDVTKPTAGEQRDLWTEVLGHRAAGFNGAVDRVVSQFNLGVTAIREIGAELRPLPAAAGGPPPEVELWDLCRAQTRPGLEALAQRRDAAAEWEDLVLPEAERRVLREIVAQVRQRFKVYETWGLARKCGRGLGISALFAGPSGTGKTLAAEVLAHALRLDLYRIDLSAVVSKYIGETEKNLRRIFDAAEDSGVILLFDEADALFGKRSEVRDSHDRYANIEVSYLLQRMEAYRGLAILTTNLKSALDAAFLRRLRFVVQFPFPDPVQRAEIWRRMFPAETPTDGLDCARLAALNVPGGNIRNIAVNAAFLAADDGQPVRMTHLLRAARTEYAKLEKALTDAEVKGWT